MLTLTVLVAVAGVVGLLVWWFALRRETLASPPTLAQRYNCSQSWAVCPGPDQQCYWGDQPYNKGRCCRFPWSGTPGCVAPNAAKYPKPADQCPAGTMVHDDGTCWDHKGSTDSAQWAACDKYINRYKCPPLTTALPSTVAPLPMTPTAV